MSGVDNQQYASKQKPYDPRWMDSAAQFLFTIFQFDEDAKTVSLKDGWGFQMTSGADSESDVGPKFSITGGSPNLLSLPDGYKIDKDSIST